MANISDECIIGLGYNENVLNDSGCREGYGGSKWESAARVF